MELDGTFPRKKIRGSSVPSPIFLRQMSSGGWFQGAALAEAGSL